MLVQNLQFLHKKLSESMTEIWIIFVKEVCNKLIPKELAFGSRYWVNQFRPTSFTADADQLIPQVFETELFLHRAHRLTGNWVSSHLNNTKTVNLKPLTNI